MEEDDGSEILMEEKLRLKSFTKEIDVESNINEAS